MKCLVRLAQQVRFPLGAALFLYLSLAAQAGGYIQIDNKIPGQIDAPIYQADGKTLLGGSFALQIRSWTSSQATNSPDVRTNDFLVYDARQNPGYITKWNYYVEGANPGDTVYVQLALWDPQPGYDPNARLAREEALLQGSDYGESDIFTVQVGTYSNPGLSLNLGSFSLWKGRKGTVDFRNLVPGILDAPMTDTDGATRLEGIGRWSQLRGNSAPPG